MRAETGPMRFEEDWNGLFIRGDNALLMYLPAVRWALENLKELVDPSKPINLRGFLSYRALVGLAELLDSVDQTVVKDVEVTRLKPFEECVRIPQK